MHEESGSHRSHGASDSQPPGTPSSQRSGSIPRREYAGAPPSYRPTPPYSPPKPHKQLQGSGLDSPRSVSSHHSQRSSRSGAPSEASRTGSLRRGYATDSTPNRPSTLPLRSAMTEPRPHRAYSGRPPFSQELSFNATSHPDLPTATRGPSITNTTSHPNLAWHPKPPCIDTNAWATQYDTDVAVYKQHEVEPPSQVSSSTDSGYGHGHAFDSLRNGK